MRWSKSNLESYNKDGQQSKTSKTLIIETLQPEQRTTASASRSSDDGQNVEEDVYDVCVEVQSSEHVFFWTQSQLLVAEQQLCVHRQELQTTQMFKSNIFT